MRFAGARLRHLADRPFDHVSGTLDRLLFNSAHYAPSCYASNAHNEELALLKRVLASTPTPTNMLDQCISWAKREHQEIFPRMRGIQSVPFAEYLQRTNASASVKRQLQQTHLTLESAGVDENSALTASQLKQFTERSSFVKMETALYNGPADALEKLARLIQGAPPEFIVLVGPWVMAMQDLLKRRWGGKSWVMFTSGKSSEEVGAYVSDHAGKIVEDDISAYDTSINQRWCEYEVWLARKFGAPRAVRELMTANIRTHGHTAGGWRYKCMGTRKSGDPYTSVMNSIINAVSHAFLYCRGTGVSMKLCVQHDMLRMAVQGDDNVLRHKGCRVDWNAGMRALGFDSKAFYRRHLEDVEFCSSRLYSTTGGWVFGPKPGRVLAKLCYLVNPPRNVRPMQLVRGIALGLRKACNFIHPLRVVIDHMEAITRGEKAVYRRGWMEHVIRPTGLYEPTVDTMYALNHQYDWDFGDQKLWVDFLRQSCIDACLPIVCEKLLDRDVSAHHVLAAN